MPREENPKALVMVKASRHKNLALYISLLVLFVIDAFVLRELPFLINNEPFPIWSGSLQALLFAVLLLMGGTIILYAFFYLKYRPNLFLVAVFSLAIVFALASTYSAPSQVDVPFLGGTSFGISDAERGYYAISSVSSLLAVFVLFTYLPQAMGKGKILFFLCEAIIIFSLASIIYSVVVEFPLYQKIFLTHSISSYEAPKSWTMHKNAYGRYILLGVMAELYLLTAKKQFARYSMVALFCVALFFTMAKTPILLSLVFLFSTLTAMAVTMRRTNKIFVAHLLGIVILGTGAVLFLFCPLGKGPLSTFIASIRSGFALGEGSFSSRIHIWNDCLSLWASSSKSIALGFGTYYYQRLIAPAMDYWTDFGSSHNVWIEALGQGGVVRLALYFALIGYIVYLFSTAIKGRNEHVWLSLAFAIGLLFQSMVESIFIFETSLESILFFALLIFPLFQNREREEQAERRHLKSSLYQGAFLVLPSLTALALFIPHTGASMATTIVCLIVQLTLLLSARAPLDECIFVAIVNAIGISLCTLYQTVGSFDFIALGMSPLPFCIAWKLLAPAFLPTGSKQNITTG